MVAPAPNPDNNNPQPPAGAGQDPASASAPPPATPSPSDLALWPFGDLALSPADESLLESLAQPGADLPALAASGGRSLAALARWLREPHVQPTYRALRRLFAEQHTLWRQEVVKDAVETLREVMKTADCPIERRRSATAIVRALTASQRPPRPTSPTSPTRARRASEGPAPSATANPHPDPNRLPSDASTPSPRSTHARTTSKRTWTPSIPPLPTPAHGSPDTLADDFFARFQALKPTSAVQALTDLYPVMNLLSYTNPGSRHAMLEGIAALGNALKGATITSEPSIPTSNDATKLCTLTYTDNPPAHFRLTIYAHDYLRETGPWFLDRIEPVERTELLNRTEPPDTS